MITTTQYISKPKTDPRWILDLRIAREVYAAIRTPEAHAEVLRLERIGRGDG